MTEPNDSDDVYVAGFLGSDQLDTSETLTGDNTQDPLDAGYSPPDREPRATRFGTTADEQRDGETLDQLLAEEEPDVFDRPDEDEDTFGELEPRSGRLVAPDEGAHADEESDAVAADLGRDGGTSSAEEAAMHVFGEPVGWAVELTKFSHACVRLDDGERRLVLDPGVFSEVEQALDDVSTVLITHEHVDHVDVERLRAAADADSALQVWAPASLAATLSFLGDRLHAVAPGESFEAGGFTVETFGGQHALIHPQIPVITNVGYLIDGSVYHPGDSFVVPPRPVGTLLLPLHAPWSKTSEVVDFAVSVRAPRAIQIHDWLLVDGARAMVEGMVGTLAGPQGVQLQHVDPATTVTV